ncbi:hypothetical protein [Streptomyces sp. SID3343]|uniref:hypothetical protein n=1 Tax=Streptomyces sp. SID3343 TaxID=2690260 RepID=UPI00136D76BD|nr:hypothetical protein [Streptomyces sp. SID3343]MYW00530.1 hypothetical protein [Streptomyces sp. SID3343]
MDLSRYHGYFLDGISVAAGDGGSTVSVSLTHGDRVVLELSHVVHVKMDSCGDWDEFVDRIVVRELPRTGPWPTEARHLLHHNHNNDCIMVWVRLIGPSEIEILGRVLTVR